MKKYVTHIILFILLGLSVYFLIIGRNKINFLEKKVSVYKTGLNIAFINTQRVKKEARPFQELDAMIEDIHKETHTEVLAEEEKIRRDYHQLKKLEEKQKKPTKSFIKKKNDFDKKVSVLEKKVQKIRTNIAKKIEDQKEKIETLFNETVKNVAEGKKIDFVINSHIQDVQSILYAKKALDITGDVILRMNKVKK